MMDATELIKKVRKIEIKTRGLSRQVFAGHYHSAFKGRGMAFSEVREYHPGDDIRSIDWNVTARFNHPYVKVFDEEREMTVMLMIDVSGSTNFGAAGRPKDQLIAEIAGVLAFSAIANNDKVGVVFFSDQIEKFIPPKKGSTHILRIIRELIDFKPTHTGTNLTEALIFLRNVIKKRSVAFMISDFQTTGFEDALSIVARKHDLICLSVNDPRETYLPPVGLVRFRDAETGQTFVLDTAQPQLRAHISNQVKNHNAFLKKTFSKAGVDTVYISSDQDFVPPLMRFFQKRSHS